MKKNIKKLNKNYKSIIITYLLSIVITIVFFIIPFNVEYTRDSNINGNSLPSAIIKNDVTYSQTFKSNVNNLHSIGIVFSTYNVVNKDGTINISMKDSNNNIIYNKDVNLIDLPDNMTYMMEFDNISHSKGKEYKIEFKYIDYKKGNSLAYWFEYDIDNSNQHIMENDNSTNTKLIFKEYGYRKNWFLLMYIFIIIVIDTLAYSTIRSN